MTGGLANMTAQSTALLLAAGLFVLWVPHPIRAEQFKVVNLHRANSVHLRERPSGRSRVVGYIPSGTGGLRALGPCSASWCNVAYGGKRGWVFRKYLAPDDEAPAEPVPTAAETAAGPLDAAAGTLRLTGVEENSAVDVQEFPGKGMPVIGSIPADAKRIEDLGRCVNDWCHVRYADVTGWVARELLAKQAKETAVGAPDDDKTGGGRPRPQRQAALIDPGTLPTETKTYLIAGLLGDSTLSIRERPEDDAPVLGTVADGARDVEGLQRCVTKWCLIRHQGTIGWVLRRHLADESIAQGRQFLVIDVPIWDALEVKEYPAAEAEAVGAIPSYGSGIVPIGACDGTWCHIRYLGMVGWVSSANLVEEDRPGG